MQFLYPVFCTKIYCVGRGIKLFDVHFWWIRTVNFPSKIGKGAVYEGKIDAKLFTPLQIRQFSFVKIMIKVLFPNFTLSLPVNI